MTPIDVTCPKCRAAAYEPCASIKKGGRIGRYPYRFHKKREHAAMMVPLVLSDAVPVRATRQTRPQVGAVDSAVKALL